MSRVRIVLFFALMVFLASCSKPDDAPIKINAARVSASEFDRLYKAANPKDHNNPASRQEFLEELINRKLMLLEAERMGLDRDPQFLKEVQDFWQERLLKSVLRQKGEEYKQAVQVTDAEIKGYFEQHPESFAGTDLEKSSDSIRQLLFRSKQQMMMEDWLKSLRDDAQIEIDDFQLGIQP